MCTDNTICLHEPVNRFSGDLVKMKEYLDGLQYKYVGVSDSSIGVNYQFYLDNFKYVPIVNVKRNTDEVVRSFSKVTGQTFNETFETICTIEYGLSEIEKSCDVLEVDYNKLNDEKTIQNIFEYCMPFVYFDSNRYKQFQDLFIIQHRTKVLSEMDIHENIANNNN